MSGRKKALVTSSYPAPYRVGVFQELAKVYDLDVFFDTSTNENRNENWFCKSGDLYFEVLNNETSWKHFKEKLKNIKQYDFIIAYDYTRRPSRYVILKARIHGIPYFINCDGSIPHKGIWRNLLKWIVYPFIFKGATGCFASGESAVKNYLKYGAKEDRIFIHHFTSLTEQDILKKPYSKEEKCLAKEELGLPQKTLVLSIGQFIRRKGFDILLRAWKDIDCDAALLLIGGGDERSMYEDMIHELNLKNVMIRDFMPKSEIFRYYKAADIFVLPTREDIWGLVINEAMAQGIPIITTDNCVAGVELIKNGVNGYVVKTGSVEELSCRLNKILQEPKMMTSMILNNINSMDEWTMKNVAQSHIKYINLYFVKN